MKVRILSKTEKDLFGADMAVVTDFNDVAVATSAAALTGFSVLAGTKVQCVGMKMTTAFDRAGTGALAVTVGDGVSATGLQASTVLAVDGTEVFYHVGGNALVYTVDDTVDLFFTDAGGMAYTVGEVVHYFRVEDMNRWTTR